MGSPHLINGLGIREGSHSLRVNRAVMRCLIYEPARIQRGIWRPSSINFVRCTINIFIWSKTLHSLKKSQIEALKAIALCFKPYLKPEEAMVYCNLAHTQLAKRLQEFGVYKNASGYYSRQELDIMMSGQVAHLTLFDPKRNHWTHFLSCSRQRLLHSVYHGNDRFCGSSLSRTPSGRMSNYKKCQSYH